jgi:hypothetical protein
VLALATSPRARLGPLWNRRLSMPTTPIFAEEKIGSHLVDLVGADRCVEHQRHIGTGSKRQQTTATDERWTPDSERSIGARR